MTVTLQLANQVRRLGCEGMTVEQIAFRLGLPEQAIIALSMLGLPLPGETSERRTGPTEQERGALLAKLPKRWQDRAG